LLTCFLRSADPKRDAFSLESHTNETVGEAKARIADKLQLSLSSLSFISVRPGQFLSSLGVSVVDPDLEPRQIER
jgi:hypothetical protein